MVRLNICSKGLYNTPKVNFSAGVKYLFAFELAFFESV